MEAGQGGSRMVNFGKSGETIVEFMLLSDLNYKRTLLHRRWILVHLDIL